MNVFVSRLIPEAGIRKMEDAGIKVTIWKEDRPLTDEELIHYAQQHDALLCMNREKIDKAFLQACPHLKVIALYSVGYDSMDVAEATRLGIPMSNTPDVLSDATADIAFTLLLAVSRKAFFHHRRILDNQWDFFRPTANLGIELKNKTLGIFGLGRIGLEMARRCRGAYNMNVIYHNRKPNPEAEKEIDARYVSFDELLEQSDVLSLHTALTPETRDRFTMKEFRKMRSKSIFINTARGAIHREEDLLQAIQDGIIWGAGLDVTNPEPMLPDSPLLRLPSVCITPHIGSATEEARNGMSLVAATNIIAGLRGEKLPNVIDPAVYEK